MSPEEIGSLLRVKREELGRTIADAASATKISSRFLLNMEKGEFSELGEKIYVIGFTKTYAKYLTLCEKSFSEMVRKNHSEMEDFNLQMYKTGR